MACIRPTRVSARHSLAPCTQVARLRRDGSALHPIVRAAENQRGAPSLVWHQSSRDTRWANPGAPWRPLVQALGFASARATPADRRQADRSAYGGGRPRRVWEATQHRPTTRYRLRHRRVSRSPIDNVSGHSRQAQAATGDAGRLTGAGGQAPPHIQRTSHGREHSRGAFGFSAM